MDYLEEVWDEPDEGIWEVRGGAAPLRPLQGDGLGRVRPRRPRPSSSSAARARSTAGASCATQIHREVCERGFDAERGTFTQSYGSRGLDAATLMMPLVGFLAARRRARGRHGRGDQARALRRRLRAALRHARGRGRPAAGRGRVPALLVLAGRLPGDARPRTTRRARCSTGWPGSPTTSGCSPRSTTRACGRMVGNFPQAFTQSGWSTPR